MLTRLSNVPRDYAWGSTTLIAALEGREPSGMPEAEVWFGDHPGSPATVEDGSGRTLDEVLGPDRRLPFLLKVLAAASALSIQAHPSKAQAEEGFAREEAAGLPRDAGERNYRDDNHKPEVIVALADGFQALSGLRPLADTRRLLDALGAGAAPLCARLEGADEAEALRGAIGWLLSGESSDTVRDLVAAARAAADTPTAPTAEFAAELALTRELAERDPRDPGIVVALLMNLLTLQRGEALFVPAGVLHAYLRGIGVEIMSASDNVLRGGLTPKHIDVDELLRVLDATPGAPGRLEPQDGGAGVWHYAPPVPDFSLSRVEVDGSVDVALPAAAIVLCTGGEIEVRGATGARVSLRAGQAAFADPLEAPLRLTGRGELFVARPGA